MIQQKIFSEIYDNNAWKNEESKSGPGSTVKSTFKLIDALPSIFQTFNIKSVLDLPCGDFNWMKTVPMDNIEYTGADIVSNMITNNSLKYPNVKFKVLDLLTDILPTVDLIICRDCLVHFSNHDVKRALFNICQSKSKYLLVTTFPNQVNNNISMGQWRAINLQTDPFLFPEPITIINEKLDIKEYADKSMALWSIDSIKLALVR